MMSTILKTSRLAEGISDKVRQIDLEQVIRIHDAIETKRLIRSYSQEPKSVFDMLKMFKS